MHSRPGGEDVPVSGSRLRGRVGAAATLACSLAYACADDPVIPSEVPPDRTILEILYDATDGPNWFINTNWLTDAPLDDWHGVDVNSDGRVTRLYLSENRLIGTIPPELGGLDRLTALDWSTMR